MVEELGIGHNQPPSQIEFTNDTTDTLNQWLSNHPVVQSEEDAREGKLLIDRASACLKDLEAERNQRIEPLSKQVSTIREEYREPQLGLDILTRELRERLNAFIKAEEARRQEEAEALAQTAEKARQKAVEADAAESTARDDACAGVVVDLGQATNAANQAFKDFKKAERQAARAAKDQKVKIGGGFRRALSLRATEILVVTDAQQAVDTLGWTSEMILAMLKAARAYRKLHGHLPPGIESQKDRSL